MCIFFVCTPSVIDEAIWTHLIAGGVPPELFHGDFGNDNVQ